MHNARQASRIHARRRIIERHGLKLSDDETKKLIEKIQRGHAIALKKESSTRTLFAVRVGRDQTLVPVIYNSTRKTIVTVLPSKVIDKYARRIADLQARISKPAVEEQLVRLIADEDIARFKIETTTLPHPIRAFIYFKLVDGRRTITYVESNRICVSGVAQSKTLLQRHVEREYSHHTAGEQSQLASKFIAALQVEIERAGLVW